MLQRLRKKKMPVARESFAKMILAIGIIIFTPAISIAGNEGPEVLSDNIAVESTTSVNESSATRESLFPSGSRSLETSHFTWGAEVGSSLDMTGHDLSTFDADVVLGYKNPAIQLCGVGVGIHHSIHSGNNFIPVYGVIRTSFRSRPSLLFMNLQAGYSFNSFSDVKTVGDFTGALGLGVNLQQSRAFKSYVILSAAYQYFSEANKEVVGMDTHYIFFARLVIGVNF